MKYGRYRGWYIAVFNTFPMSIKVRSVEHDKHFGHYSWRHIEDWTIPGPALQELIKAKKLFDERIVAGITLTKYLERVLGVEWIDEPR